VLSNVGTIYYFYTHSSVSIKICITFSAGCSCNPPIPLTFLIYNSLCGPPPYTKCFEHKYFYITYYLFLKTSQIHEAHYTFLSFRIFHSSICPFFSVIYLNRSHLTTNLQTEFLFTPLIIVWIYLFFISSTITLCIKEPYCLYKFFVPKEFISRPYD
jgi:hypothetical protein